MVLVLIALLLIFMGYVERTIGPRGSILLHNYSVEMLKKVAKRLHFYVTPKGNDIYKVFTVVIPDDA